MRCGGVRCEVCLTGEVLLGPVLGFVDLGNRAVKLVVMRTGGVQSLYGKVRRVNPEPAEYDSTQSHDSDLELRLHQVLPGLRVWLQL